MKGWRYFSQPIRQVVESRIGENKMNYAIVFMNMETGKLGMDTFTDPNEIEAKRSFRECYRHAEYKILSVTEVPEPKKKRGN